MTELLQAGVALPGETLWQERLNGLPVSSFGKLANEFHKIKAEGISTLHLRSL
jgi:hypothetical protein